MVELFDIIYAITTTVVSVFGLLASVFTVAVNLRDWAKSRQLSTCDHILLALGISNAFLECNFIIEACVSRIWIAVYNLKYFHLFLIQQRTWNGYTSCWLTACLSVFYCVKIVDFNHRLFICAKLRIAKAVPWMLLGSIVGCLVLSLPVYTKARSYLPQTLEGNLTTNSTVQGPKQKSQPLYVIVGEVLGFFIPLLFGIISITFIHTSLYKHSLQMKQNLPGFSQPRLDAHFKAAKMVGSLLVIYVLALLANIVGLLAPFQMLQSTSWLLLVFCVLAQSIVLIVGNSKLKQKLWKILSFYKSDEPTHRSDQ